MRLPTVSLALWLVSCAHAPAVAPEEISRALALEAVGPVGYDARTLNGKVLLIDFFATWCFPCVADLPNLEEVQKRFGGRDFTVVAVGMDLDGKTVLQPFAEYYAPPFPILVASDAIRNGASVFGPVRVLPTTVILSRSGEVLAAYSGVAEHDTLLRGVQRALER